MTPHERWQAIGNRQAGPFFYGVVTTGIYCSPTCPSRRPNRENVVFFDLAEEAVAAGFRPCKRCQAEDETKPKIDEICRYIRENAAESISLAALGQRAGWSPAHLQRKFKATVGVSPKQYQETLRMQLFKTTVRQSDTVTPAMYDAGFGSSSRLYEHADKTLGMTPAQYRQGGRGTAITYVTLDTPLGPLLLGATDRGLCYLQFEATPEHLRSEYPKADINPMGPEWPAELIAWREALRGYLSSGTPIGALPLDVAGTAFQSRVWWYLQSIPSGESQSYQQVARGIGQPKAARAVARACATNRIALVIPCHRVIRGSGELGGYRWGLERKRALLDQERAAGL